MQTRIPSHGIFWLLKWHLNTSTVVPVLVGKSANYMVILIKCYSREAMPWRMGRLDFRGIGRKKWEES